jgi:Ca2+-binding EF-hand superfamily protein
MMEAEGVLEKKRRDLALRSDFNLVDAFKLFNSVKNHKRGIDCDDFYYVLRDVIGLKITHDEMFILFYKLDKDKDNFINYSEFT